QCAAPERIADPAATAGQSARAVAGIASGHLFRLKKTETLPGAAVPGRGRPLVSSFEILR
ncbi:MAG: hypothetical protein ACK49E_07615, partial [Planctomyces sp.]